MSDTTNDEGNNFIVYLTKTNTLTFQYLDYSLYYEPQLPPVFSKCTTTEKTHYCAWGLGKLSVYPTGTARYSQCFATGSAALFGVIFNYRLNHRV